MSSLKEVFPKYSGMSSELDIIQHLKDQIKQKRVVGTLETFQPMASPQMMSSQQTVSDIICGIEEARPRPEEARPPEPEDCEKLFKHLQTCSICRSLLVHKKTDQLEHFLLFVIAVLLFVLIMKK